MPFKSEIQCKKEIHLQLINYSYCYWLEWFNITDDISDSSGTYRTTDVIKFKFLNSNSWGGGGWSPIGSTRPSIGLLCQPRVIMPMDKLVEWWLTRETEVLGENMPQCHSVHHKPHTLCPDASPGRRRGKPELWHGPTTDVYLLQSLKFWSCGLCDTVQFFFW
jgi:hypothetical protein